VGGERWEKCDTLAVGQMSSKSDCEVREKMFLDLLDGWKEKRGERQ